MTEYTTHEEQPTEQNGVRPDPDSDAIIAFLQKLLDHAYKNQASCIQFKVLNERLQISERRFGVIENISSQPVRLMEKLIHAGKVMANLDQDITESYQSGIYIREYPDNISQVFDITILPGTQGEHMQIALLTSAAPQFKQQFTLQAEQSHQFERATSQKRGIILLAGHYDSGIEDLAQSLAEDLAKQGRNVAMLNAATRPEKENAHVSYFDHSLADASTSVGTIQKLDFDAIVVGSTMTAEDLELMFAASLQYDRIVVTQYIAPSAFHILQSILDLGISPWLLCCQNILLHTQKKVKRICRHCKEPADVSTKTLLEAGIDINSPQLNSIYHGAGCSACNNTGYMGNSYVSETFTINDIFRKYLIKGNKTAQLRKLALRSGMSSLRMSGLKKVTEGETSLEQVLTHTNSDD